MIGQPDLRGVDLRAALTGACFFVAAFLGVDFVATDFFVADFLAPDFFKPPPLILFTVAQARRSDSALYVFALVTGFDIGCLALLFGRIRMFVAAWHHASSLRYR